jgi:septal ring-binding cell division protein DamX
MQELGRLPETPDFAERELPPGTKLKIVMPGQSMEGKKKADSLWVANVMSSRSNDEIVPLAVRLVKRGFPMYMTRAQVKGQEWMRLRVGFFAGKAEAQEMGKKIKEAVQVEEPWVLKVGKEEYGEFAGFLETESGS